MDATIQPGLVAAMMEVISDIGCRRASFVARDYTFAVMAATPDKSVLLNGVIPATVSRPGGFSLTDREFNLMRSPSMAKANITYDGQEIAKLTYGRRRSFALASPFKGARHPAKNVTIEDSDLRGTVDTEEMVDAHWNPRRDRKYVDITMSDGKITINSARVGRVTGDAAGRASGRYEWSNVACMLNGCQHAQSLIVGIRDGGPLTILCAEEITFVACIPHA